MFQVRIIPAEVAGYIIRRDREGELPAFGVTLQQDLQEGLVKQQDLLLKFPVGRILRFAADGDVLVSEIGGDTGIQGDVGKRRLKSGARGDIDVKQELLEGLFDFRIRQSVIFDERRQERVEIGKGLSTRRFALQRVKKVNHLSQRAAQMPGRI